MQNSLAPKNFFLQIGIFFSLYVSAISFLVFLFSVINEVYPPALNYYSDSSDGIRFSISTLIVVFPLFIFLSRVYRKFMTRNPEFKEGKLRKWIIYFTLFITGVTMAIDTIVLVNTFLGGEDFTSGFMLKVLSVFVVAGAIFTFCLKDLRGYFDADSKRSKTWSWIVSGILLISIIIGFTVIGSPSEQRARIYDRQRTEDLQNIQWQVVNHYQSKGTVPTTLAELEDPLTGFSVPVDPVTKAPYAYSKISDTKFGLCADFALEYAKEESQIRPAYDMNSNWEHQAGNQCFERTIDPEKYPRIKGM
jgi:hypothetical protein